MQSGTIFCLKTSYASVMMDSLQQENKVEGIVRSGKRVFAVRPLAARTAARRLEIRDAIAWSVSFAVVALLTGALLLYRIGVTMSGITSLLFYCSLAGLVFFAARAVLLSGSNKTDKNEGNTVNLN
jgi:hypothetical protein